jgi:site-specific DNA recombinase
MPAWRGEDRVSRIGLPRPAADIDETIVKILKEHLAAKQDRLTTRAVLSGDRGALAQLIAGIVVHKDRLIVRFKSDHAEQASDSADDQSLISLAETTLQKIPPDPAPA